MAKREKLLARALSGTQDTTFSFAELRTLLLALGFEERQGKGDHVTFSQTGVPPILTVPRKPGAVKPVYVKKARAIILDYKLARDA